MKRRLEQIWLEDYLNSLPQSIKERGFNYSINNAQKDILITGINPSFRDGALLGNCNFDFQHILSDSKYDRYWSSLKRIIYDQETGIDLRAKTAYLDIFYFRETDQKFLTKQILNKQEGLRFVIDQIELTQNVIESTIKPKLIIVKNKESAAYWGKLSDKGILWMGYKLELIEIFEAGELYKITGLINSPHRVSQTLKETTLKDSLIFFTQHFQYAPISKRPNSKLINFFITKYAYKH